LKDLSDTAAGNNLRVLNSPWIWFCIYIGLGFAISFIVPFPLSLAIYVLVFLLLNLVRTEIVLRKRGVGGIKGLYKSMSLNNSQKRFARLGNFGHNQIKFCCMACGTEHRKIACPKCGSKMVKVKESDI
jgi:hypothetical protein